MPANAAHHPRPSPATTRRLGGGAAGWFLTSLPLKMIRDNGRALILWVYGVIAIVGLYLSFYPALKDTSVLTDTAGVLPGGVSAAFGLNSDLSAATGYINATTFNLLPWLFIAFGVTTGTRAIAGDEERGRLDLLLSFPIRRTRFVLDRFAAMAIMTVGLGVVAVAALAIISHLVGADVPFGHVAAAITAVTLLGLAIGSLALAAGAITGRAAVAIGVSVAVAIASYLAETLGKSVSGLDWLRHVSVFFAALGRDPLATGFNWAGIVALLVVIAAFVAIAVWAFARRDISA